MSADVVYEVRIEHNVVCSIQRVARMPDMHVPASPLEVSSELARNHQRTGCIDGCYRFDDAERARSFALIALDFVKRLIERHALRIESMSSGAEYLADDDAGPA